MEINVKFGKGGKTASAELLLRQIRRPAVGGEDSGVELLVGQGEPGGTLVVETGQSAIGQLVGTFLIARDKGPIADGAANAYLERK